MARVLQLCSSAAYVPLDKVQRSLPRWLLSVDCDEVGDYRAYGRWVRSWVTGQLGRHGPCAHGACFHASSYHIGRLRWRTGLVFGFVLMVVGVVLEIPFKG
jgi:hypothetical protein